MQGMSGNEGHDNRLTTGWQAVYEHGRSSFLVAGLAGGLVHFCPDKFHVCNASLQTMAAQGRRSIDWIIVATGRSYIPEDAQTNKASAQWSTARKDVRPSSR